MQQHETGFFEFVKNCLKFRTIKANFIIALIVVSLFPATIINFFYYMRMNSFIENKVQSYHTEIIKQTSQQIEFLYHQVEIAQRQMIEVAVTSKVFEDYNLKPSSEKLEVVRTIDSVLKNMPRSFPSIRNTYLISTDGNVFPATSISSRRTLLQKEWVKNIKQLEEETIIPTHKDEYSYAKGIDEQDKVISFVKGVRGIKNNEIIGAAQVDLNYAEVRKIVENLNLKDQSSMVVLDKNNHIIYCAKKELVGQKIKENNKENFYKELVAAETKASPIVTSYTIPKLGWTVTGVISKDNISEEFNQLKTITVFITIAAIFFAILLAVVLSNQILEPISKLIKNMKKVGEGKLDIQVGSARNKDLQVLTESFNRMVNQINQLMKNVLQKEDEKLRAELRALQSQINSHFLYNTLNSIKWMAIMAKENQIANAIVALVKVLEYTCKNCDRVVPIDDELDFTKEYVFIQKMRSGTGITVHYDIDEKLYDYSILKLTLQPMIENAFLHAFNQSSGQGDIWIVGKLEDASIIFEVNDNGSGMQLSNHDKLTGMGISNVDERIKLNFGISFGVEIVSKLGEGTKVSIKLPIIKREEEVMCIKS